MPYIKDYEHQLINQVQQSLVLFTYASYAHDEKKVPSLSYIRSYGFISMMEDKDNEKQSWSNILSDYGYVATDELDHVLIEIVQNGYVDIEKFKKVAVDKNNYIKASSARESFSSAWDSYHNDLDIPEEKLVENFLNSFQKNKKHITPVNIDGTVRLFRELGHGQKADNMIDEYIEALKDSPDLFDPNKNYMLREISDEKLKQRFKTEHIQNSSQESVKTVLDRLAYSNGWNSRDKVVLSNTSKEELVQIFKEQKKDLSYYIDACLRFGRSVNSDEEEKLISQKAMDALTEIAKESNLNRLRMKKYGIVIPD
jgi:hypothetical protein